MAASATVPHAPRLFVVADDAGYSRARDDGIIECFLRGCVSEASLLVNGETGASMAARCKGLGLPLGLHLNLTEGAPLTGPSSLTTADGALRGKMGLREALQSPGTVQPADIAREVAAQICRFKRLNGQLPHRIDGHQHVHVLPGVRSIFIEEIERLWTRPVDGVPPPFDRVLVRLPVAAAAEREALDRLAAGRGAFYATVSAQAQAAAALFARSPRIRCPCVFLGFSITGDDQGLGPEALEGILHAACEEAVVLAKKEAAGAGAACVEWMVHCGQSRSPAAEAGGCGGGQDEFSQSEGRAREVAWSLALRRCRRICQLLGRPVLGAGEELLRSERSCGGH